MLRTAELQAVHEAATRLSTSTDPQVSKLAWWVLRIMPTLDRVIRAHQRLRTAVGLERLGRAQDERDDAVRNLVRTVVEPTTVTGSGGGEEA